MPILDTQIWFGRMGGKSWFMASQAIDKVTKDGEDVTYLCSRESSIPQAVDLIKRVLHVTKNTHICRAYRIKHGIRVRFDNGHFINVTNKLSFK